MQPKEILPMVQQRYLAYVCKQDMSLMTAFLKAIVFAIALVQQYTLLPSPLLCRKPVEGRTSSGLQSTSSILREVGKLKKARSLAW